MPPAFCPRRLMGAGEVVCGIDIEQVSQCENFLVFQETCFGHSKVDPDLWGQDCIDFHRTSCWHYTATAE